MDFEHRQNRKKHALQRFYERYGFDLPLPQYNRLIQDCKGGIGIIGRTAHGSTIHEFKINYCNVYAVYNRRTAVIVTFLHETAQDVPNVLRARNLMD